MKTKIEIKTIFGNVLFEYEAEDNNIKKTLEAAVKSGADIRGADLSGADLRGADLRGAYLSDWGKLQDTSDILIVGPIGSRSGYTTIYHTEKGVFVMCGCFRGTLDEFAKKVEEMHGDNKHARDYKALIEFAKAKYTKTSPKRICSTLVSVVRKYFSKA